MRTLFVSLLLVLCSAGAHAAPVLTQKVYATPVAAARNITVAKLYSSWGGHLIALGHVKFATRLLGANGPVRRYEVSNAKLGLSRTATVVKVPGGWKAFR